MKKLTKIIVACILGISLTACTSDAGSKTENKIVKVGVVGENNELWTPVQEKMKEKGVTIELVKFSDYSQPNEALASKEIDLNAFQHKAFLEKDKTDRSLDLTVLGDTIIAPLGLYSTKYKSIDEIKEGETIAIPSDATNGGRALKVLETAGLIKIDPSKGYNPTVSDITENPKNLVILELEAAQTAVQLDDPKVAAAIINGGHALDHNLNPATDPIYLETVQEGSDNPFINIIACRTEDKDNELYNEILAAYHSDDVKKVIDEKYKGAYLPAWN